MLWVIWMPFGKIRMPEKLWGRVGGSEKQSDREGWRRTDQPVKFVLWKGIGWHGWWIDSANTPDDLYHYGGQYVCHLWKEWSGCPHSEKISFWDLDGRDCLYHDRFPLSGSFTTFRSAYRSGNWRMASRKSPMPITVSGSIWGMSRSSRK